MPPEVEGARWVPLTSNKWSLVDADDYERVMVRGWCASRQERKGVVYWYATATTKLDKIRLHRFILCPERGVLVDHRNGDTLDNRRQNLREATRAQNAMNRKATTGRPFKGVTVCKRTGRFIAHLAVGGRWVNLGRFDTQEEAARAYDAGARIHFGEFARTNFSEVA